jgi:hypothetical protein
MEPKSWGWTCVQCRGFVRLVEDPANAINRLLTEAGIVMEDASEVALVAGGERSLRERIAATHAAGLEICRLAAQAYKALGQLER